MCAFPRARPSDGVSPAALDALPVVLRRADRRRHRQPAADAAHHQICRASGCHRRARRGSAPRASPYRAPAVSAVAASFVIVGVAGLAINAVFHFAPPLREVRTPQLVALFLGGRTAADCWDTWTIDCSCVRGGNSSANSCSLFFAVALAIGIDRFPNPFGGPGFQVAGSFVCRYCRVRI